MEIILAIAYSISIYIEIKKVKKMKLSVWSNNNLIIMMAVSTIFPLAIFCILFGIQGLIPIILKKCELDLFSFGFSFCMFIGGLSYIISYIKNIIYNYISDSNKSFLYRDINTFYE